MKPVNKILTYIEDEYQNEIKSESGFTLLLSNVMQEAQNIVKHGLVREAPIKNRLGVQQGDVIYFHHNEVRRNEISMHGKIIAAPAPADFIPHEKLYMIDPSMVYVIQRGDEIIEIDPFCFIAPYNTKQIDETKYKHVIVPESINKIESDKLGIVRYGCKSLRDKGVNVGDVIGFTRYSKYTFPIRDEKLFRMKADWIIYKLKNNEQEVIIS